jgi:hypothetical protein
MGRAQRNPSSAARKETLNRQGAKENLNAENAEKSQRALRRRITLRDLSDFSASSA